MKRAYLGFVAGMAFTLAVLLFDIWWQAPRQVPVGGDEYGVLADLRQC